MKHLILILLAIIFLSSCCETTKHETKYLSLIGAVNVKVMRIAENGTILGTFYPSFYLSGIKVELLCNGQVVETTYTLTDSLVDNMYLLKKIQPGKVYKIKITLNSQNIKESQEFTVNEQDLEMLSRDSLLSALGYAPQWFKSGNYYLGFMKEKRDEIVFDLNTNYNKISAAPNPFTSECITQFQLNEMGYIKLEILDIKYNTVKIFEESIKKAGIYAISFGNNIDDGLYILHLNADGEDKFFTVIKGKKGTPVK